MAQAVLLQLKAIDRAKGLYIFAEPVTEVRECIYIYIYAVKVFMLILNVLTFSLFIHSSL